MTTELTNNSELNYNFFKKNWRMRILGAVFFLSLLAGKSKIFIQMLTRSYFWKTLAHAYYKRPYFFLSFLAGKFKILTRVNKEANFSNSTHHLILSYYMQYDKNNLGNLSWALHTSRHCLPILIKKIGTRRIKWTREKFRSYTAKKVSWKYFFEKQLRTHRKH